MDEHEQLRWRNTEVLVIDETSGERTGKEREREKQESEKEGKAGE